MNESPLGSKACITQYWKHDNDDVDLDTDLLGLLQSTEDQDRKAKIRRRSRTKSHEAAPIHKNFSREQFIDNQRTRPDVEQETDGQLSPQRSIRILSKIPLKSQHTLDDIGSPTPVPSSPAKFNPDYAQITDRNITPVKYPTYQESPKKIILTKKPSFNVGFSPLSPVQSTEPTERRNHLKVSALLDARRNQSPQQTILPGISSFHVRTQSHTPILPPLQKLVDQSPLNLGEEMSPNKSGISPFRQNYRESKLRNFEIVPQSIDEVAPISVASVPHRDAHKSPSLIRGVREVSREYLRDKSSILSPLLQPASNKWASPEGNEEGLKSLIKLPRLKKNISSENSPSLVGSALYENGSQNRIAKEGNPLNTLIDRKLTKVFTKATMNDNIMFQKAASRQWRDLLGSTEE